MSLELQEYSNHYLNFNNLKSTYKMIQEINSKLAAKAEVNNDDSAVNYRKTFYEQQAIETASYVYIICLVIYGITAFIYLITLFRDPNSGRISLFLSLVGLILFPYFSITISLWIMKLWKKFMGVLPSNVYRNL